MFNIQYLLNHLSYRRMMSAKRPWAHFSKKGPGRKHQQGRAITKQEREQA
jgi:hypothetical protein